MSSGGWGDDDTPPATPPRRRHPSAMGMPIPPGIDGHSIGSQPYTLQPHMLMPSHPPPAIEPKTKLAMPLMTAFTALVFLVTAVWTAGGIYTSITRQLGDVETRLGTLPTKHDLSNMRYELIQDMRARVSEALVRCPPIVRKGDAHIDCKLILPVSPVSR